MDEDQVILMTVTGFNRGGLLVQNDGFRGSCFSHPVDRPSEKSSNQTIDLIQLCRQIHFLIDH
jgi:hypothetical protein